MAKKITKTIDERITILFNALKWAMKGNRAKFHEPRANSKLGDIPAWNILPVVTCSFQSRLTCAREGCYAVNDAFRYGYDIERNNVLKAWTENTLMAMFHLDKLEEELTKYFEKHRNMRFFRIHSSGDFFNKKYAMMWYRIAKRFPEIKFLAFTKQWEHVRAVPFYELENFSLVLSGWTGITIPEDLKEYYKSAFCVEHGDIPPTDSLECPGSCTKCAMCWHLKKLNTNTFFNKH